MPQFRRIAARTSDATSHLDIALTNLYLAVEDCETFNLDADEVLRAIRMVEAAVGSLRPSTELFVVKSLERVPFSDASYREDGVR